MRRKSSESKQGAPEWMNTYGDMITLVLTFFVLLYAYAQVDLKKFEKLKRSFNPDNLTLIENMDSDSVENAEMNLDQFDKLKENLEKYLNENNLSDLIKLQSHGSGILVSFENDVLFDSGKAELKSNMRGVLYDLGDMIQAYQDDIESIRIEGHTDNVPINTPLFSDNWDLSTARATTVIRFFIEITNISPPLVSASGYSEYHPVADNGVAEGRAKNRRVEVFLVRKDGANNE